MLPDPLTTSDHDVSGLDGFMLNTDLLMASELWALASGDEFKAAVGLWCRAWKQTPAGSLPSDDRVLAAFSGAGKAWPKVKDMALRGFVKCSDGRLYHKTLCNDVVRASKWKSEAEAQKAGAADRKRRERDERSQMFERLKSVGVTPAFNTTTAALRELVTQQVTTSVTPPVTQPVTVTVTAIQGQDRTGQEVRDDGIVSTGATFVPRETGIPHTDQFAEIETALREAAGWQREPHPNLAVVGPVIEAIKAGVDLELDLLPAARAHGPTLRKRTSWNYIIQVAITNRDNRLQAASNAAKPINAMPTNGPRHGKPTDRTGNLAALIGDQPGRF
jgi:uncharacterized protein YdaU (DUF1376 family)